VSALKFARISLVISLLVYGLMLVAGAGFQGAWGIAILATAGIAFSALACVGIQLFVFARKRLVTHG
jgi:hypothetical protein